MAATNYITDIAVSPTGAVPAGGFEKWAKLPSGGSLFLRKGGGADPVIALRILYGDEPAPAGFSKLPEDVNSGQVYIAVQKGKSSSPFVDLKTVKNEEVAGDGWEKISRDIGRRASMGNGSSSSEKVYICFKTEAAGTPLSFSFLSYLFLFALTLLVCLFSAMP